MELKYYRICRIRCKLCDTVLEWENQSKEDQGPSRAMYCCCGRVGLDPSAAAYRVLGSPENVEDTSEEWDAEERDFQQQEQFRLAQNQLRKAMALKSCIRELEVLQRRHAPAFDDDKVINEILTQARTEHEAILAILRKQPEATKLLEEI